MAEIHDARNAILKAMQEEQREIRADQRKILTLIQQAVQAQSRQSGTIEEMAVNLSGMEARLAKKMGELRDDLSLVIKSEIGGGMAHMETRLEVRQDQAMAPWKLMVEKHEDLLVDLLDRISNLEEKAGIK